MPEKHPRNFVGPLLACIFTLAFGLSSQAQTFKVLYNFVYGIDGGGQPFGSLVIDKLGNLYGTTSNGGAYGYGSVFELSPNSDGTWTETTIYSFAVRPHVVEGHDPMSNLIFDTAGNLYSTTYEGGVNNGGSAFKLTPGSSGWSATWLHNFGFDNSGVPAGGLIMDAQGNLYGVAGGPDAVAESVYELSPGSGDWTENAIYRFEFNQNTNGYSPVGNLLFDATGNLYGVTNYGGDLTCLNLDYGCGVVFRLTPNLGGWKESVLHSFAGGSSDGAFPSTQQLAMDSKARLYGATWAGAGTGCEDGFGCGSIFRLIHSPTGWNEALIHTFGGGLDGYEPTGLTFDQADNAYGTAYGGGTYGYGVVFKLVPGSNGKWTYSVLHAFLGSDGAAPESGVILDSSGNVYGTTVVGGSSGLGVVYEIMP
jgi:uncharacterized repeat protein (TIGR03803 family)